MASLFIVHPNLSMTNIDNQTNPNIKRFELVYLRHKLKFDNLSRTYSQESQELDGLSESTDTVIGFFDELLDNSSVEINSGYLNSPRFKLFYQRFLLEYSHVEFKYLKSYKNILAITKQYFSKKELTVEDETAGLELISEEMENFNMYEKQLGQLIEIGKKFRLVCGGYNGDDVSFGHAERSGSGLKTSKMDHHASVKHLEHGAI